MTDQQSQERLQRHIGAMVHSICVAFWADMPNARRCIIGIGINFHNGPSFVLSCAGDGGIVVRKGQLGSEPLMNIEFHILDMFSREVIESVDVGNNRLDLYTRGHRISIVNNDDNLEVTVDGEGVMA